MKITKQKSTLGDVEEYLFEHCEDFDITQYDVMMDPEDKTQGLIGVSGVRTIIDSLDISVREGIFFNYNEEDNT
jgi:hypothetical protein